VLRPATWSGRPGEALEVQVQTKGVVGREAGGTIHWQAGERSGELPAPGGTISVTLNAPGVVTLAARWLAADGSPLATNQVDLACVGFEPVASRLRVTGDGLLAATLRGLGYDVQEGKADSRAAAEEIVVTTRYTRALQEHLHRGGRVLLLAGSPAADDSILDEEAVPLPVGQVVPRAGTPWQGDWATSFAWVKKQGPLAHLPGGPLLEMAWAPLMPDAVIAGLPPWVQRNHSWAGLAVGWVQRAVSLLLALSYGRGRLVVTTFKLDAATLAADAMGQALFAGALNLL
jgi:hypothetical protein